LKDVTYEGASFPEISKKAVIFLSSKRGGGLWIYSGVATKENGSISPAERGSM
jgi:hypothetical protein